MAGSVFNYPFGENDISSVQSVLVYVQEPGLYDISGLIMSSSAWMQNVSDAIAAKSRAMLLFLLLFCANAVEILDMKLITSLRQYAAHNAPQEWFGKSVILNWDGSFLFVGATGHDHLQTVSRSGEKFLSATFFS